MEAVKSASHDLAWDRDMTKCCCATIFFSSPPSFNIPIVMPVTYPPDRSACMSREGPSDHRFRIAGGVLLYHPKRDARFPYLYRISTHALVHSPDLIKTILIRVVDTSIKARVDCAQFDKKLSVPLGPNALMHDYGMLFWTFDCDQFLKMLLFRFIWTKTWHNLICPAIAWRWKLLWRRWHCRVLVLGWVRW